ncbi:MAG: hypothetical protein IJU23_05675 [Proteobacteria bacterium]|nr:hypothetical protein [Pseudomonadota bacterium]MBQ9818061.1 hypothetical protein [Pseudomonadota bacterium]
MSMYDQKKFDKRLIERHLAGGAIESARITEADLKAHLDALPDVSDKCEPVTIDQPIREKPEQPEEPAAEESAE